MFSSIEQPLRAGNFRFQACKAIMNAIRRLARWLVGRVTVAADGFWARADECIVGMLDAVAAVASYAGRDVHQREDALVRALFEVLQLYNVTGSADAGRRLGAGRHCTVTTMAG